MYLNLFQTNCLKEDRYFKSQNEPIIKNKFFSVNLTSGQINQNVTNHDELNYLKENIIIITKLFLYIVMMLVSLFGNFLILFVFYYDKTMRISTNFFIFNLAICDLAILFSSAWVQILLMVNDNWLLGKHFCKISYYLQMVLIISSVLTLTAISYDRYKAILYPLKSATTDSRNKHCFIIASIWIASFILSIPTYFYRTYVEINVLGDLQITCGTIENSMLILNRVNKNLDACFFILTIIFKRLYFLFNILFLFFFPLLIMAILYIVIIKKLWKNCNSSELFACASNKHRLIRKNKKIILMLVLIFVTFFICWLVLFKNNHQ